MLLQGKLFTGTLYEGKLFGLAESTAITPSTASLVLDEYYAASLLNTLIILNASSLDLDSQLSTIETSIRIQPASAELIFGVSSGAVPRTIISTGTIISGSAVTGVGSTFSIIVPTDIPYQPQQGGTYGGGGRLSGQNVIPIGILVDDDRDMQEIEEMYSLYLLKKAA